MRPIGEKKKQRQIDECWEQYNRAAATDDGQENLLRVVSDDVSIKPDNKKRPRTKRSYKKGQRRRRLEAQLPQPAA